ncbi:MAG: cold shock domain-containing protein [Patescibacteria group bacterium]
MKGIIKRINEKGFGFITPEEGGKDVFFHNSDLLNGVNIKDLSEGQTVSFDMGDSEKGPKATNVEVVEAGDEQAQA